MQSKGIFFINQELMTLISKHQNFWNAFYESAVLELSLSKLLMKKIFMYLEIPVLPKFNETISICEKKDINNSVWPFRKF